jgi:hypothetical protein
LDSLRDEFEGKLTANAAVNETPQVGLENLKKELLQGLLILREELLSEISKAKDECRRMVVESSATLALKMRPKCSMTITHSDGTESIVSEQFDGEEDESLPLPPNEGVSSSRRFGDRACCP